MDSLGVYSPRRSTADGLPILQFEPLDDERPTGVPPKLSMLDPPVRLRAKG